METVILDQEKGLLEIGPYTIHPHLTYSELEANYPDLNRQVMNEGSIVQAFNYRLPRIDFLDQQIETTFTFYDRLIDAIYIPCKVEGISGVDEETYMCEMADWSRRVKHWLITEFGSPSQIRPPVLLDEDRWLLRDEIAHLDYWIYTFPWGEFGYTFHWETEASLHCHFDKHYQNRNWDGLRDQYHYWSQQAHWKPDEVKQNQPLVEAAINILSANFDYGTLRVLIGRDLSGLIFDLPQWSTRVILEVRPDR